ncbi:MAG TPA: FmdB family zinc ribbon protein [Propionibacteriaceae bacterium]|nr:FmdB family zinc ribbon protein [Propionibacteriaceae bacterium]
MPTYQYRCTECGRDLEIVQKFSDPSLTECPTCSGALRKVFNAVGVVFKGSGFYRTDSRAGAKDGSDSAGSDRQTAESTAKAAEGSTESKPKEDKAAKAGDKPAVANAGSGSNGTGGGAASSTVAKAAAK